MKEIIEKSSLPMEMIFQIYIYLSNNCNNSKNVVESIIEYFAKNKNYLSPDNIIYLLNNLQSEKIIEEIFNNIDNYFIKENDLFNIEKELVSFKLLKGIQESQLKNIKKFEKTKYFLNIENIKKYVKNCLIKGNIKYNIIFPIWSNTKNKKIFKERINILFMNEQELEWENEFQNFIKPIRVMLGAIKNLLLVLNAFYTVSQRENIKKYDNLERDIKNGFLCDFPQITENESIENINNIIPNFDKKKKLKDSFFFVRLFHSLKEDSTNIKTSEEKIFIETEKEFEKLLILFKENEWVSKIDVNIINECYNVIKEISMDEIKIELNFIKKYFYLNDVKDEHIQKIQNELFILSKREEIFLDVNSCLYFINELKSVKTEFSEKLESIKNNIKGNILIEEINEYCEFLENNNIKIFNLNDGEKNFLDILKMLYNNKGSIDLILTIKEEQCRYLQEIAFDADNCFITSVEIQAMSQSSDFIRKLNIIGNGTTDLELISIFKKAIIENKNIIPYFAIYTKNYSQIKDLFMQKLYKTQTTRKIIKNICQKSHFTLCICNEKEEYFSFSGEYFEEEENNNDNQLEVKNNIIKLEDLIEFRGRAMLAKKLGEDKMKEEKEIFELNQFFSERVNEISKINLILQKIAKRGYSENIMIEIIITDLKTVYSFERKIQFKDYQDCIQFLNEILKKTTETQLHFYKQNEFIRYIYGRQFNLLYSYLKRKGQKSIEPFLKYLSNDKIYYNLNENNYIYINSLDENDKYKCLLENCSLFISSLLQEKNISLEMILEQNQILPEYRNEFRGLYTYLKEDDKIGEVQKGIEEQILNWYHFLTGNSPMAQSLLLCNEETTLEEITSFLYRAFLCQYQVFFVVAKIELLTPENRQQLTDLINSLYIGHEKEMKSCLAFAYSDKTSTIVEYF